MAYFEGKLNLNVETSEIEIMGKFKLTEDELDKVAGGQDEGYPYVCQICGGSFVSKFYGEASGQQCPSCRMNSNPSNGDERVGVDEALADPDALMADVDGFDF